MRGPAVMVTTLFLLSAGTAAAQRYRVAPEGNAVRYRVRERLARLEFPNDAVGETRGVTGTIEFGSNGDLVPAGSRFTIDLASLQSDQQRRDRYLRTRTLQTDQHPTAEFFPVTVEGLSHPIPDSGEFAFTLVGDLVVRGVRRPIRWAVTAHLEDDAVVGSARTTTTFDELGLKKPSLAMLLDVSDTIGLEYDFRLIPAHSEAGGDSNDVAGDSPPFGP